ncbi:Hypothetical_protein [Hexamita inflata]|uniref:Hypothetical_protein n=1 Tax=Hexamita inflata TaxID=28002 RepID=A0AA86R620_9EUKA|nr:Hypothetical protein HINF_LOCUS55496 [Hexamita inflata]
MHRLSSTISLSKTANKFRLTKNSSQLSLLSVEKSQTQPRKSYNVQNDYLSLFDEDEIEVEPVKIELDLEIQKYQEQAKNWEKMMNQYAVQGNNLVQEDRTSNRKPRVHGPLRKRDF